MKKQVGGSAGFLALLALLFHTQYPSSHESRGGEGTGAEAAQNSGKASGSSGADPREGPWIATRAFFQRGEADFTPQNQSARVHSPCIEDLSGAGIRQPYWSLSCLISASGAPDPGQLRSLIGLPDGSLKDYRRWSIIASVADPLHTRLPLFADRQIEAIQRSLQADHWQMAAQWLPWGDSPDPSENDIEKRRGQRRLQRDQEQMPGVVVFRRLLSATPQTPEEPLKREILLLFVIPETPTGGVAGPPFFAAMHFATAFTEPELYGNKIGLLMPSFSGSFPSLTVLVRAWNDRFPKASPYRIGGPVFGGSASSFELAKAFSDATGLEFHSGVAATEDYKRVFCRILERYEIKDYEAAYLAEDGTAYGQMFEGPQGGCQASIPRYVFPRDISHLRDVYQDETGGASRGNNRQDTSGVSFSIKDSSRGEDSVPTFSDAQTPLSQSAAVSEIIDHFRRRRTRLVYIAATNPLDTLFLARLLRREAPDTRVLTSRPDVLFLAAASQEPLTGTVALSTYPMFFKGDEWLTKGRKFEDHILFTDPAFEGLYNVTQALVKNINADLPLKNLHLNGHLNGKIDRLRAFRQLQNGWSHPGLWLLTLGHTGYYPVDLLDEPSDRQHKQHSNWFPVERRFEEPLDEPDFPPPPRGWLISSEAFSIFVFLAVFLALRVNFSGRLRSPVWLVVLEGYGRGRLLIQSRLVAITGAALSLSAMEWILFLPLWRSTFEGPHYRPILERAVGVAGFGLPLAAVVLLWRRPRARLSARSAFYVGLIGALWLIVVAAWAWSCFFQGNPAALLFRYRALDLYSGASPALPFLVLGIVSLSGFLFYLKRFTRAGLGRPCLELDEIEKVFESLPLRRYYQKVNHQIVAPAQMGSADWRRRMFLSALAVLACVSVVHFTTYAAAFENRWYNRALACAVAMLLFSLATTCYDLLLISRNLQKLLGLVDFLPLREAFKRISRDLPHRPIWSQQPAKLPIAKQMRIALDRRRQLRCDAKSDADFDAALCAIPDYGGRLHQPEAALLGVGEPQSSGSAAGTAVARALAPRVVAPAKKTSPTARSYLQDRCNYERLCARLTAKIVDQDLRHFWTTGIEEPKEEVRQHDADLYRCCSDFVALQFFRYLTYVVDQVRSIAWCLSFALLMLMVTLNSYSPQAPQLIGRFLAILFLGLGVIVFRIFAQMERDAVLSRIAGTKPGELNQEFWIQVCAMGALPLIGVMSHLFPSIAGYLHSWVVPGVEALK